MTRLTDLEHVLFKINSAIMKLDRTDIGKNYTHISVEEYIRKSNGVVTIEIDNGNDDIESIKVCKLDHVDDNSYMIHYYRIINGLMIAQYRIQYSDSDLNHLARRFELDTEILSPSRDYSLILDLLLDIDESVIDCLNRLESEYYVEIARCYRYVHRLDSVIRDVITTYIENKMDMATDDTEVLIGVFSIDEDIYTNYTLSLTMDDTKIVIPTRERSELALYHNGDSLFTELQHTRLVKCDIRTTLSLLFITGWRPYATSCIATEQYPDGDDYIDFFYTKFKSFF